MDTSVYRNLAEQVQKNKEDILKHFQRDEVLADFGIRIIGQVETVEELNALPTEGLEYGDAYAVGAQSPFNYYIWTRANNINPNDYWFAFGEIAIAGPQGPKGDRGATGATGQSTRWYLINDAQWSYDATGKKPGDMVLTYPSGQVYMMGDNGTFTTTGNIKGPQGIAGKNGATGPQGPQGEPGPKGDTGDVGGFINIAGVLTNEYDLPDPSLINNLTVAYLVGTMEPYSLYIQVGSNSRVAEWLDAGPLNVATMVTVNGQYQNTWNADTKLDKVPLSQVVGTIAYTRDHLGNNNYIGISASTINAGGLIPVYNWSSTGEGVLKTGFPKANDDCVNKGYADANYGPITVPVEDQITSWDDGGDFSIKDTCFYTIHTFATYLYQGATYTINFKPVSMFTDFSSNIKTEVNFVPDSNKLPGFTDEMLNQIRVNYYFTTDNPEICNYWLIEPSVGYPDEVSGLSLTIILEKLY